MPAYPFPHSMAPSVHHYFIGSWKLVVSGLLWQNYYRALDDLLRWMSWYLEMEEKSKQKYSMVSGRSSHTHSSLHPRLTEEPWVTSQTVCKRFVTHTLPSNTLSGQLPDGQSGERIQGWNGILWSKMQGELWTKSRVWENRRDGYQVWRPKTTGPKCVSGYSLGNVGREPLTSKNCFRRMKEPICPELVMASIL